MNTVRSLARALWQHRIAVTLALAFLLVAGFLAATYYVFNLPRFALDHQQTVVLGPTQFAPENPSALRVVVRDNETNQPIANANVAVYLAPKGIGLPQTLYTGKTDTRGTAPVAFVLPANTAREQTLIIETNSGAGRDRVERAITVARSYKVLVTTDKPLYQPGQLIHLRALALGATDRVPAKGQDIEFLIEDPKGNKIYRKTIKSSDYGIVSADFQLAETLNAGNYKITASIGDTKSEKTVNVKPYVLPKFKVAAETERSYYLPGEKVSGKIRVDYFFGKPVAKSDVTIKGIVYDVARAETINLSGKTDDNGVYSFAFTLPNYFAGTGLNKDRADFGLEISVTDQANHTEQTSLSLAIASGAIMIDAVPESGRLVAGVENIVYILTSLPDGSPLETGLTISVAGTSQQTRTGKYGLAEAKITPQRGNTTLAITAQDAQGRRATRNVTLQSETTANQILLRPDRAAYRVGETMKLDALTSNSTGTVYLDIIKEKQTISTRAEDAVSGRATISVDVTAEMIGTLQLHAYHVERDGTITRDTRVVVVEQPSELNIAIMPDRDVYRPGDTSKITFNVTNAQGKGVQSALGVAGVDEAVFALAEQDPGFAKLYFLLQKELLEPKYQVKGFTLPEVVTYQPAPPPADIRAAQTQSANAAWALATPFDFVLRANSQQEKRANATKAQAEGYNHLAAWLALFLALVPIFLAGFVVASLAAKKILGKSLALWLASVLAYCIASPFFIGAIALVGALFIQLKLGVLVVALVAFALLAAFIIVAAHAIIKRDLWLQAALILLAAYFVFVGMFAYIVPKASTINEWMAFGVILTYLGALATVVLIGIGLIVQKEIAPGLAALLLVLIFIPATILLAMMPSAGPFLRTMGHPALYIPPSWLTGCAAAPAGTPAPGSGNLFRDLQGGIGAAKESAAQPMLAAPTSVAAAPPKPGEAPAAQTEQPRLRQYFPETLYFNPQVITNENGTATLDIPLADSITTWRLAVTASSQRGELGANTKGVRVFQDFFVDLDLPVALTQNDEISIPVAVYNYLTTAQKVRLQIEKQPWFELQDQAEKTLTIASNDIDVVYFRIKALNFGTQKLKVTALGEKMSDAIQRDIRVYPDGKPFEKTVSNWLKADTQQVVEIPVQAIPGASRIQVMIYPGIVSQVVNGLDGLLRMPFG
jgi:5-hydroxyisourate hydrolase-like protein (transthyretin family)